MLSIIPVPSVSSLLASTSPYSSGFFAELTPWAFLLVGFFAAVFAIVGILSWLRSVPFSRFAVRRREARRESDVRFHDIGGFGHTKKKDLSTDHLS